MENPCNEPMRITCIGMVYNVITELNTLPNLPLVSQTWRPPWPDNEMHAAVNQYVESIAIVNISIAAQEIVEKNRDTWWASEVIKEIELCEHLSKVKDVRWDVTELPVKDEYCQLCWCRISRSDADRISLLRGDAPA